MCQHTRAFLTFWRLMVRVKSKLTGKWWVGVEIMLGWVCAIIKGANLRSGGEATSGDVAPIVRPHALRPHRLLP